MFTFRGNSYLLLASSTTYSLIYVMKLINFGPISSTKADLFSFHYQICRKFSLIEAKTHTSATKVLLNMTDSDTTDLTYVES